MSKLIAVAGLATLATALAPAAFAEEAKDGPYTFTGNLTLASEYRYRGIAQTLGRPALQGGFDLAHASGFYLGTWASNISWIGDTDLGASASLEWDWYGGYKGTVGDFGYDVGGLYYWYPGSYSSAWDAAYSKPNTFELYLAGTWKTITAKYSYGVTDLFGNKDSKGSGYFDLTGSYELGDGWNAVGHVGYQYLPASASAGRTRSDGSYTDWKLGVTKDVAGVTVGLSYIGTNANAAFYTNALHNKDLGKGTALLSVTRTF